MVSLKYLDSYILWEINRGNPKFLHYLEEESFVVNELTLAEYYGVLLREYNEQTADYWFHKLEKYAQPVSLPLLIKAIKFRQENKKHNFSFFDAVGYIFAKENNGIFVTGDKEFRGIPGVEFISVA